MILKKHLPLGAKYFAILGLVALPTVGVVHAHQHHSKAVRVEKVDNQLPVHHHAGHPKLGGVASFNYSFDDTGINKTRDSRKYGDWAFQNFRLNAAGEVSSINYFVEYGWFRNRLINLISNNESNTYNHFTEAYASHKFHNGLVFKIGNTRVPFGNPHELTYWRNIAFYSGFAENYKPGFKFEYCHCPWNLQVQLGKNDIVSESSASAYFPKVTTGVYLPFASSATNGYNASSSSYYTQNNENNLQLAARLLYAHHFKDNYKVEFGLSGKMGSLYNNVSTSRKGSQWAGALHMNVHLENFFVQLQYLPYKYTPKYPDNVDSTSKVDLKNTIQLGKDGALYTIPTQANIMTAGVGYNLPVSFGHIKGITVYDDYSILSGKKTQKKTKLNIIGFKFNAGPLYVTAEAITGKNMVGIGQDSLPNGLPNIYNIGGSGTTNYYNGALTTNYSDGTDHWKTKFNLNLALKF